MISQAMHAIFIPKLALCGNNSRHVVVCILHLLTHDCELYEEAPDGLRADLALVPARVLPPRALDLQHPLVAARVVVRLVAHIGRVREPAHGEDVQVAVADPRHLENISPIISRQISEVLPSMCGTSLPRVGFRDIVFVTRRHRRSTY